MSQRYRQGYRHPLSLLSGWDMVLYVLWMVASGAVTIGILKLVW